MTRRSTPAGEAPNLGELTVRVITTPLDATLERLAALPIVSVRGVAYVAVADVRGVLEALFTTEVVRDAQPDVERGSSAVADNGAADDGADPLQ